jgi:hypothetical protein
MAANSGDLVQSLIEGGLAPQAARIIGNVLANAASPSFSKGRDAADSTPSEQLRLITADSRRYSLTNLDFSPSQPFRNRLESKPGRYAGPAEDHPYKDSQPVTSAAPLSAPRVQEADYVAVENTVEGNAAVSKIGLRLRLQDGRHLRVDPSTKFLDALPLVCRSESPKFLAGEFIEGEQDTELVISLRNLTKRSVVLSDGTRQEMFVFQEGDPSPADPGFLPNLGVLTSSEGVWSPYLFSFTGTQPNLIYNAPFTVGQYLRVGQWVTASGRVRLTSITSAGTGFLCVRGLPFPVSTTNAIFAGSVGFKDNWQTNGPAFAYAQDLQAQPNPANDAIILAHGNTVTSIITAANLTNTTDITFSVAYRTDAP